MVAVAANNLNTGQVTMTGAAVKVVGSRSDRKRVTLVMSGTVADTFIGNSNSVTVGSGVLLAGVKGQTLTFESTTDLYAIGTAAAVVAFAEEWG